MSHISSEETIMLKKYRSNIDSLLLNDAWKNDSMHSLKQQIAKDLLTSSLDDYRLYTNLFSVFAKLAITESNNLRVK